MNRRMYLKILVIGMLVLGVRGVGYTQLEVYSFSEINKLQQEEKRNVVVFIYTDWCKYCHAMNQTTLKDANIVQLLNERFWFGELNGEENNDILFNGQLFKYKPVGNSTGIHELADQLAKIDGEISYPTLCILNPDLEIVFQYNQFMTSKELEKVLRVLLVSP